MLRITGVIASAIELFAKMPVPVNDITVSPLRKRLITRANLSSILRCDAAKNAREAISVVCASLLEIAPRLKNEDFYEETGGKTSPTIPTKGSHSGLAHPMGCPTCPLIF